MPLLGKAIESYKEMADYGGNLGIRVTLENHWGLAADPMNIRIIIDEVNSPYCEASPDFCNWEYDYMLVSGLKALAPYAHTNVHAKYWDRWGDKNDVQRSVRIMLAAGYKGTFALEYEDGPLNGIEGAKYLYKEVLAALSSPVPVIVGALLLTLSSWILSAFLRRSGPTPTRVTRFARRPSACRRCAAANDPLLSSYLAPSKNRAMSDFIWRRASPFR